MRVGLGTGSAGADAAFGDVLQSIGTAGGATIVVVSVLGFSDGEGAAAGGLRLAPSATRVPFVVRGAGVAGTTVFEIVEVVDLVPTVLGLAELEVPPRFRVEASCLCSRASGGHCIAFGESPLGGGEVYSALGGFHRVERPGGERKETGTTVPGEESADRLGKLHETGRDTEALPVTALGPVARRVVDKDGRKERFGGKRRNRPVTAVPRVRRGGAFDGSAVRRKAHAGTFWC